MPKNNRIIPALDESVEYALRKGWITQADMAGVAQAYVVAGVIDNSELKPIELASLCRQLQTILDKYNLSAAGRKEIVEEVEEVTPLDNLRKIIRTVKPEIKDDNLYQLP